MSTDSVGKKISDLRVCDLKTELEKRGLETTGIKVTLAERLNKVNIISKLLIFFFFASITTYAYVSLHTT